jgi:hypothetical protein
MLWKKPTSAVHTAMLRMRESNALHERIARIQFGVAAESERDGCSLCRPHATHMIRKHHFSNV